MKKGTTFTRLQPDDKQDIIRLNRQGISMPEIARYIGCSVRTIFLFYQRTGLRTHYYETLIQRNRQIMQLYDAGLRPSRISRLMGLKNTVVRRVVFVQKRKPAEFGG